MNKNTIRFTEKDKDGNDVNVVIKKPTAKDNQAATVYSNKVFADALRSGCLTRQKLDDHMREQGLWNDEKADMVINLANKINDGERQLARGGKTKDGKPFTKKDARALSIKMLNWRAQYFNLLAKHRELDMYTAQAQAENAKFDYLVSCCCFDEEKNRLFTDIDDYTNKAEEPYAVKAASEFSTLISDFDPDYIRKRPEVKFLLEYKFVNDDLQLINENGELVDNDGHRIDKDGFRIDDDGNRIDNNGDKVDEDGNPLEDFTPFAE